MSVFDKNTHLFKKACRFTKKKPVASMKRSKHGLGTKTRLSKKGAPFFNKKPAALNDSQTWIGVTNPYKNVLNIDYYELAYPMVIINTNYIDAHQYRTLTNIGRYRTNIDQILAKNTTNN